VNRRVDFYDLAQYLADCGDIRVLPRRETVSAQYTPDCIRFFERSGYSYKLNNRKDAS
jgi:hypothetical protein